MEGSRFHIVMFPWLAVGHITPFLHLSNELAERGHQISFLLPQKAQIQLQHINLHPNLIKLYPLSVPHVDGLPFGTETASEIPISLTSLLAAAMDLMRDQVQSLLLTLKPDFVFYDFAYWIPELASKLGFKTVCYSIVCAALIGLIPVRNFHADHQFTEPPPGYPLSTVVLRRHEARSMSFISSEFGSGITFYDRYTTAMKRSHLISIRTCRELEGDTCDYIANQYGKPVILTGPILPQTPQISPQEDQWVKWLDKFKPRSVVFCAFGSQVILEKEQFQQLVLGFELTGLPFLVAVKPPTGAVTIEEALPVGFEERTRGRGVVYGGWVQQPVILGHSSVGCFVHHGGSGSMWESLMCDAQIVIVPHMGDHILHTRLLAAELKVAVEVERDGNGRFANESLCNAINAVMDGDSEVGRLVKKNHEKWKETLTRPGFASAYMDNFVQNLRQL